MPFLVVAGITVPVASWSKVVVENVDDARAFNNTARTSVAGTRKYDYPVTTTPGLSKADADALIAAMPQGATITCSGDMLGASGSYKARVTGYEPIIMPGGPRVAVSFTLMQV